MSRINVGRLVLAGFVAGVVANVGDAFIQTMFMVQEGEVMRQRLNLDPAAMASTGTMVAFVVADFILGFVLAFTYVGIRPRFGPGPATATLAALVVFFAIAPIMFGFMMMGIFAPGAYIKSTILWFLTIVVASVAGAALYKE